MGKYKPTGRPRGRPRKQPVEPVFDELADLLGEPPSAPDVSFLEPRRAALLLPERVVRGDDVTPDEAGMTPAPAKKRPPQAHWWKPGQSGNPSGRPPEDPALRAVKMMTKAELGKIGQLILDGDYETLVELAADKEASVLTQMFASVCLRIINKGDASALDMLLNRIVGKVKDEIEHSGNGQLAKVIVTLPSNGREAKSA